MTELLGVVLRLVFMLAVIVGVSSALGEHVGPALIDLSLWWDSLAFPVALGFVPSR